MGVRTNCTPKTSHMLMILGYLLSVVMGILLGLLGGGGVLLTVPILVYIFQLPMVLATGYALWIVGITSAVGFWKARKKIQYRVGGYFAIPSLFSVFMTRHYLLPILPDPLFLDISLNRALLLLLSGWIYLAAYTMLHTPKKHLKSKQPHPLWLSSIGIIIGSASGLLGISGGLLIVPALHLFAQLEISKTIPTALMIITIQSFAGCLGDLRLFYVFDWYFLSFFIACSLTGMLIGQRLAEIIHVDQLKKYYGYSLLLFATFILLHENHFK